MLVYDGKGVIEPPAVGADRVEDVDTGAKAPQASDDTLPVATDLLVKVERAVLGVNESAVGAVPDENPLGARVCEIAAGSEGVHVLSFHTCNVTRSGDLATGCDNQ